MSLQYTDIDSFLARSDLITARFLQTAAVSAQRQTIANVYEYERDNGNVTFY